jgi:cyanophycinase
MQTKTLIKNHRLIILLVVMYFFGAAPLYAARIMLIGGALEDDNASIFDGLMKSTGKVWNYNKTNFKNCDADWKLTRCPRMAVVTSASENLAAGIAVYNTDDLTHPNSLSYHNLFQKWGYSPKHVQIAIDNYHLASKSGNAVGDANIEIIKQADVVFLNGGDQSRHSKSWLNSDGTDSPILKILRDRVINNEVVIAGSSAGTAVQGQMIYGEGNSYGYLTVNDLAQKSIDSLSGLLDDRLGNSGFQFENNGGMMNGFGFLSRNIAFDTHFEARSRLGRMVVAMNALGTNIGIGVDENTAFFMDDNHGVVYGASSVFIVDTSYAIITNKSNHFNITGALVNVLNVGDKFNFNTNSLVTFRPKIKKPQYQTSTDSSKIYAPYEATKLISHLIDQVPNKNNGFGDKSHPGFHYEFIKDRFTCGYYLDNEYTAEKVKMNIMAY